jgi:glycosyltransferase involved in cell wall biosynthesis
MEYKYCVSLCLCIKNEAKYIEDFLEHYVKQGVEHFYIVNNCSTDNTNEVIINSKYYNLITLIEDKTEYNIYGHTLHLKDMCNNHFYDIIRKETEWAIIVDIDEFMFGKNGHTIKSYIKSLPNDVGSVYVMWNVMNPCRDENNMLENTFSIKQNTYRVNYDLIGPLSYEVIFANSFGKSIIRTSSLLDECKLWIHKISVKDKRIINYDIVDDNNWDNIVKYHRSEENYRKLNITLNHYVIRDYNDYIKKKAHSNIDGRSQFIKGIFEILNLDKKLLIEDNTINTI